MLSYLLERWSEGGGGAAIPQNPCHPLSLDEAATQLAQYEPALSSQTIATKKYHRSTERQTLYPRMSRSRD